MQKKGTINVLERLNQTVLISFIVLLKNYFTQWMKLSEVEHRSEGVVGLKVKDQFINSCSKELTVHLMEKKPQNFRKLVAIEKQY